MLTINAKHNSVWTSTIFDNVLLKSIRVWLSGLRLYLQSDRDKTLHSASNYFLWLGHVLLFSVFTPKVTSCIILHLWVKIHPGVGVCKALFQVALMDGFSSNLQCRFVSWMKSSELSVVVSSRFLFCRGRWEGGKICLYPFTWGITMNTVLCYQNAVDWLLCIAFSYLLMGEC